MGTIEFTDFGFSLKTSKQNLPAHYVAASCSPESVNTTKIDTDSDENGILGRRNAIVSGASLVSLSMLGFPKEGLADNNSVTVPTSDTFENGYSINDWDSSEIGNGGRGFIWSISEVNQEEEWRHSVAPIPALKLKELPKAAHDELEIVLQDDPFRPLPDGRESGSESECDDILDESQYFEKEVEATFLRAVHEKVEKEHVILKSDVRLGGTVGDVSSKYR